MTDRIVNPGLVPAVNRSLERHRFRSSLDRSLTIAVR